MQDRILVREITYTDPADIFPAFAGEAFPLFLDSVSGGKRFGRYSYLCANPYGRIVAENGHWTYFNAEGVIIQEADGSPFSVMKELMAQWQQPRIEDLPPFQTGMAGLFSYDLGRSIEELPLDTQDDMAMPEMAVGFYDCVLAFDHETERCWIMSSGLPEKDEHLRPKRAKERADRLEGVIAQADQAQRKLPEFKPKPRDWHLSDLPDLYRDKVAKVVDYILAGDIFQANLSQRFATDLDDDFDPVAFYMHLRKTNPAPFSAYLAIDHRVVASSSPERFISLVDGLVEARPIKGTRPRGNSAEEDHALSIELQNSEKDRAENVMIVDLLRNDISKVCEAGSVKVPEICTLESYVSVHHLVSTVTGVLSSSSRALDLIEAAFPGGSITGAPKIRAMEIIEELEIYRRGPYCGSIGYVSFAGDMDTSILIRTVSLNQNKAVFQAGGGIVADSDPDAEYEETLVKARKLFQAFDSEFDPEQVRRP